ncbi:hypothetical protein COHA_002176 [Chlorella ohadii]|uniref:Glutamine amidotransferase domain-containing protein n=1 Tax=Chlorella ohadii TaxID=2649997 RepID=A0AAD5DXU2_9CHLO|nr:hypothetical protein COHA_002176 [Chlorella ohadii]
MRFAYLDCEDAAKWAGHEVIAEALLHSGASWQHFRCFDSQLPPLDSLAHLDGVLISGSHYSAYEDHRWIRELEEWLRQAVPAHPHVRFLAICFGAQVMAQALGGQVGKNPDGGFVLKVESVQLSEALRSSAAMQLAAADAAATGGNSSSGDGNSGSGSSGGGSGSVRIIQSHGDQVLQLPPSCVVLAHSPTAPVEMFSNTAGNLLAVQGHVELSREETLEKIWPAITASGRLSPAEESEESRRSLADDPLDAHLLTCLFRRFMERGLPEAAAAAAAAALTDGSASGRSSSTALVADGQDA